MRGGNRLGRICVRLCTGLGFGRRRAGRADAQADGVQEFGAIAFGQIGCAVTNAAQHVIEPVLICLGKIAEDKPWHAVFVTGVSDSEPHAIIMGADMLMDRAQPVVARMSAARFQAHFAGCEVDFIVKNDNVGAVEFEKPHRLAHGLTRQVHEGFGLEKNNLFTTQPPLA